MDSAPRPTPPSAQPGSAPRGMARRPARSRRAPPTEAETARLLDAYRARGGQVTRCPSACLVPIQTNTGLPQARSTAAQ